MKSTFYSSLTLLFIIHIFSTLSCNSEDPIQEMTLPNEPGTYELSFETKLGTRWYTLILPTGFTADEKIPMVFALHPGTANMSEFIVAMAGLIKAAEENTWMMVFPNGVNNVDNRTGECFWNAIHCCALPYRQNVDDVGFIESLYYFLIQEYKVDTRRVYATGRSNGGMMVHRLGAEIGNIFAAIAPFASPAGGQLDDESDFKVIDPYYTLPILMMHGMNDLNTHFYGGLSNNMVRTDISFEDTVNIWLNTNGCNDVKADTTLHDSDLGKTWILEYKNCSSGADVVAIAVENSGHKLPRVFNSGFDGEQAIVQFFKTHTK